VQDDTIDGPVFQHRNVSVAGPNRIGLARWNPVGRRGRYILHDRFQEGMSLYKLFAKELYRVHTVPSFANT
jgi:hypothetical protein